MKCVITKLDCESSIASEKYRHLVDTSIYKKEIGYISSDGIFHRDNTFRYVLVPVGEYKLIEFNASATINGTFAQVTTDTFTGESAAGVIGVPTQVSAGSSVNQQIDANAVFIMVIVSKPSGDSTPSKMVFTY